MFGTTPKRATKLEVFSVVFLVIILFAMGIVSVMATYSVEKPDWKTYRISELESNCDMQKTCEILQQVCEVK